MSVFIQVLLFTEELISLHVNSDAMTSKNTLVRNIFPIWMHSSVGIFGLGIICSWHRCQTEAPSLLLNLRNQGSCSLTVGSLIHCLRSHCGVVAFILLSFYTASSLHLFFLAIWCFVIWKLNDTLISSTNGKLSTWNLVNLKELKCYFCECIYLETSCQCYISAFTFSCL